jgi:hypothetical protein
VATLALACPSHAAAAPTLAGQVPASALRQGAVRMVSLATAAERVVVRVRRRCAAATTVRLTLDHQVVLRRRVRDRRYRELAVALVVPRGQHRVRLTAVGGKTRRCRRPLATGAVRFLAAGTVTPPGGSGGATSPTTAPAAGTTPPLDGGDVAPPSSTLPAPSRPRLAWAPPALVAPTTLTVGQGDQRLALSTAKDYIIKLGSATHLGGLVLDGGRNVVIIGGRIAPPRTSSLAVGLAIVGTVGTVHVEGVSFDGSSGHEFDAVQINAPKATVQLENLRATGLRGSYDTNHTDIVQPWGGVARLHVDRLSGTSNYQGLFVQPDKGPIGAIDLRHVDLAYDDAGARTGGYLLWLANSCRAVPTALSDVYVKGRPGATLGSTVWPPSGQATDCPATIGGVTASWPKLPVTGVARWGTPPDGAYVKAADAGTSYTSPGYG